MADNQVASLVKPRLRFTQLEPAAQSGVVALVSPDEEFGELCFSLDDNAIAHSELVGDAGTWDMMEAVSEPEMLCKVDGGADIFNVL